MVSSNQTAPPNLQSQTTQSTSPNQITTFIDPAISPPVLSWLLQTRRCFIAKNCRKEERKDEGKDERRISRKPAPPRPP
jgi:hypothetical protein